MTVLNKINEDDLNSDTQPDPQTVDPVNTNHLRSGDMDEVEEDDLSDLGENDDGAYNSKNRVTVSFTEYQLLAGDNEDINIDRGLKQMVNDENSLHSNTSMNENKKPEVNRRGIFRVICLFSRIWGYMRDPYEAYVDFMYHLFDLSFGMLMFYFTIFFYIQCIIFAFLIYFVGLIEPECIVFDGSKLNELTEWFDACWTLSWTTFSTTGYGNTSPSLSETDGEIIDAVEKCFAINTLLMIVSFVGIVYAGAAGAILYSKVEKIKGEGQVSFSDLCVVRYGSGLIRVGAEDEDGGLNKPNKTNSSHPCPVLEFRLMNHNHHTSKGVIANCMLNCLGSVEDERDDGQNKPSIDVETFRRARARINLPRRLFLEMELTNADHPFFRRCWTATHILDQNSPLIKKKMKKRIRKNAGCWPDKYNTARSIKKNIQFKQLIVNFTGVSKRTSKEVHAQQVYDIRDILVGYQFINILEKNDEKVEVQEEYLNDITEQNGDDEGEELQFD